jgi:4-amino-4-deoxy-L-arabinose transferase-like glycosyltransferase
MTSPERPRWGAAGLAVVLGLAVFALPLALDVPLLDPDEGLHASIAREMVERGDALVPTFLGEPFLDKPILFFWAQALALRLLGFTEQAVRVPGLLFGWLGAVTTGLVAARLLGRQAGLLAGIAYTTLFFPAALAQAAVHDIALVPFVNLAVLALLPLAQAQGVRRWVVRASVAGAWLGLSVLTKGLAGLVFAGIAIAPLLLMVRGIRREIVGAGLVTIALALVVAAPWYSAVERVHPGYLHYYFLERHVEGYAVGSERHGGAPWWYYGPVLLAGGLPWITFVPAALRLAIRKTAADPAPLATVVLAASWLAGGFIFVSAGSAKLSTYLLPAFPSVALLAAVAWLPWFSDHPPPKILARGSRAAVWSASLLAGAVVAFTVALAARMSGAPVSAWRWALVLAIAATWVAPALVWKAGRPRASFATLAACTAFTLLAGLVGLLPAFSSRYTARELAWHFNRAGRLPSQLLFVDERLGSFPFYLSPALRSQLSPARVRSITPSEAFTMRAAPHDTAFVLTTDRAAALARFVDWEAIPSQRAGHHVVAPADALVAALRRGPRAGP